MMAPSPRCLPGSKTHDLPSFKRLAAFSSWVTLTLESKSAISSSTPLSHSSSLALAYLRGPPDLIEYIISSEYATLKFLEGTSVPAPQAFGYALASDPGNLVGVTYLLIQALPGKPYYEYLATPEQTARVMEQFADIMIELGKHPLGDIGSLTPLKKREGLAVGPLASNRFLHLDHTLGAFSTAAEYYASVAQAYLDILAGSQLVQSDAEAARQFYEAVRDNASIIATLLSEFELFFLKHVDDKGDHLLVDEDYNIVGIIDWQFARVVPAAEAFGPSLLTADMGILYAGAESGGPTAGDKILADALRKKEGSECHRTRYLARVMAGYMEAGSSGNGGNNLMRRIQFGIPAGSSAEETKQP
ncbi:hypothetical protein QBC37DRAFT_350636 [Rhypophila decipiens]|uniref:Aminoglycoside phosphotransferase domain-containing protein n=1 Tax=Rhypophila decipiens TaxID=261697 RepID=A0AAN6Y126_9PEZI|nr:hypothetical protein QBC37DRAFT_350636 [Rhypophila decipiens]